MKKWGIGIMIVSLGALILMSLNSCAFGTRHVDLSYSAIGVGDKVSNQKIVVEEFKDNRIAKMTSDAKIKSNDHIGDVRNTYGMKTAKVLANNDVPEYVTKSVVSELENSGFEVIEDDEDSNPNDIILSGELDKFYCGMYFNQRADIAVRIEVTYKGKELLDKTYIAEGKAAAITASSESYSRVFNEAMQKINSQVVADVIEAVKKLQKSGKLQL